VEPRPHCFSPALFYVTPCFQRFVSFSRSAGGPLLKNKKLKEKGLVAGHLFLGSVYVFPST